MEKRFTAFFLCLCMVLGLLPTSVFAAEKYKSSEPTYYTSLEAPGNGQRGDVSGNGQEVVLYGITSYFSMDSFILWDWGVLN